MSTRQIEQTYCDICQRSANGDEPDFIYAMNCGHGHDICNECVTRLKVKSLSFCEWICPICNKEKEVSNVPTILFK